MGLAIFKVLFNNYVNTNPKSTPMNPIKDRFRLAMLVVASILFVAFSPICVNAQSNLLRYPAISSNGQYVTFSYQGDIWIWSKSDGAKRLTIHEAYDHSPIFSPDGKEIAFGSDRYGNEDIFTMSIDGSMPKRVTYRNSSDMLTSWEAGKLLFESNRDFRALEWDREIQMVDAIGGTPYRAMDALGKYAALSPDGSKVAFVKGSCRIEREAFTGSANLDLWLYDLKSGEYTQLTTYEGNDYKPKWSDNNTLYFISSRSGKYNIYTMKVGDEPIQITKESALGIYDFDVSDNGDLIYTVGLDLKWKPNNSAAQIIKLTLPSDYRFDPVVAESFKSGVEEYAISPNNENAAIGIHGEIFGTPTEKEKDKTVNVSSHAYRDRDVQWMNDSTLIFASDRDGNYELYMAFSTDENKSDPVQSLKHGLRRLTKTVEHERNPAVSPDGKQIVFSSGRSFKHAMIAEDGSLKKQKTLFEGWNLPEQISWSPDSKWIAYSQTDLQFNDEIFILKLDGDSKPVNVSMHPKGDGSPVWSQDGTKLFFESDRNNGDRDIWFAWLTKKDWLKADADHVDGYYFDSDKKDEKKKDKKSVEVHIDVEGIHNRLVQLTSEPGTERIGGTDNKGEFVYFTATSSTGNGSDLYKIKWNGEDREAVTKNGTNPYAITTADLGNYMYYISRGRLQRFKTSNDKSEAVTFNARMKRDYRAEMNQMFDEGWRVIDQDFYDPNHHGRDWNELKKIWKPLCLSASTLSDFRIMFNRMLGQLNASHMGMYGSDRQETQSTITGLIGAEIKPVKQGIEVLRVIPGGPADRPQSMLAVGDVLTHINGQTLSEKENFYAHFEGTSGQEILLKVKAKNGMEREIAIRPVSSIGDLLYEEWVQSRQKLTESFSGGKLGYIHIRGMNMPSFERFERELMAAGYGKDGIVIDVRWNGGGWTTDYLMAVLNVRQHAYTIPRGASENLEKDKLKYRDYYPFSERLPLAAWTKASIALCNQSSYSNAEIFSHAYKNLDIGTLVGVPTFGAVISTGGERLIDGSLIRKPFRGWYVKKDNQNMDFAGAEPDIIIENDPNYRKAGDKQLQKAVKQLLTELE